MVNNKRANLQAKCARHINGLMAQLDEDSVGEISKILAMISESPHLLGKLVSILNSLHDEIESGKMDASHVGAALRNL